MKICVVIPTKNEAATIGRIIESVRSEIKALGHEMCGLILADDSSDNTREIAKKMGASIVIGGGKGLGFAMWKGLRAALATSPDIIVSVDGDGQSSVEELEAFLRPILNGEADLVLGSRFLAKDLVHYNYRWKNRIGIRILVSILRHVTKLPLTDSHGGLRAMSSEVVAELEMIGTHTYVQETIIDAHEKGFRIKEIPSIWKERNSGKSRVVRSIPLYIFYTLPVLVLRSGQHIRMLYPLGIFFLLSALADFVLVAYQTELSVQKMFERRVFHFMLILVSMGFTTLCFGFVLELVNRIKSRVDTLVP